LWDSIIGRVQSTECLGYPAVPSEVQDVEEVQGLRSVEESAGEESRSLESVVVVESLGEFVFSEQGVDGGAWPRNVCLEG
jgi:hypothetical protein